MRTLVKNIKELVGVESTPQLRKQGKEMGQLETANWRPSRMPTCS